MDLTSFDALNAIKSLPAVAGEIGEVLQLAPGGGASSAKKATWHQPPVNEVLANATKSKAMRLSALAKFSAVHKDKTLMERAAERVPASAFIDGFSLPGMPPPVARGLRGRKARELAEYHRAQAAAQEAARKKAQAEEELLLPSSSEDEQEKSSPMRLVEVGLKAFFGSSPKKHGAALHLKHTASHHASPRSDAGSDTGHHEGGGVGDDGGSTGGGLRRAPSSRRLLQSATFKHSFTVRNMYKGHAGAAATAPWDAVLIDRDDDRWGHDTDSAGGSDDNDDNSSQGSIGGKSTKSRRSLRSMRSMRSMRSIRSMKSMRSMKSSRSLKSSFKSIKSYRDSELEADLQLLGVIPGPDGDGKGGKKKGTAGKGTAGRGTAGTGAGTRAAGGPPSPARRVEWGASKPRTAGGTGSRTASPQHYSHPPSPERQAGGSPQKGTSLSPTAAAKTGLPLPLSPALKTSTQRPSTVPVTGGRTSPLPAPGAAVAAAHITLLPPHSPPQQPRRQSLRFGANSTSADNAPGPHQPAVNSSSHPPSPLTGHSAGRVAINLQANTTSAAANTAVHTYSIGASLPVAAAAAAPPASSAATTGHHDTLHIPALSARTGGAKEGARQRPPTRQRPGTTPARVGAPLTSASLADLNSANSAASGGAGGMGPASPHGGGGTTHRAHHHHHHHDTPDPASLLSLVRAAYEAQQQHVAERDAAIERAAQEQQQRSRGGWNAGLGADSDGPGGATGGDGVPKQPRPPGAELSEAAFAALNALAARVGRPATVHGAGHGLLGSLDHAPVPPSQLRALSQAVHRGVGAGGTTTQGSGASPSPLMNSQSAYQLIQSLSSPLGSHQNLPSSLLPSPSVPNPFLFPRSPSPSGNRATTAPSPILDITIWAGGAFPVGRRAHLWSQNQEQHKRRTGSRCSAGSGGSRGTSRSPSPQPKHHADKGHAAHSELELWPTGGRPVTAAPVPGAPGQGLSTQPSGSPASTTGQNSVQGAPSVLGSTAKGGLARLAASVQQHHTVLQATATGTSIQDTSHTDGQPRLGALLQPERSVATAPAAAQRSSLLEKRKALLSTTGPVAAGHPGGSTTPGAGHTPRITAAAVHEASSSPLRRPATTAISSRQQLLLASAYGTEALSSLLRTHAKVAAKRGQRGAAPHSRPFTTPHATRGTTGVWPASTVFGVVGAQHTSSTFTSSALLVQEESSYYPADMLLQVRVSSPALLQDPHAGASDSEAEEVGDAPDLVVSTSSSSSDASGQHGVQPAEAPGVQDGAKQQVGKQVGPAVASEGSPELSQKQVAPGVGVHKAVTNVAAHRLIRGSMSPASQRRQHVHLASQLHRQMERLRPALSAPSSPASAAGGTLLTLTTISADLSSTMLPSEASLGSNKTSSVQAVSAAAGYTGSSQASLHTASGSHPTHVSLHHISSPLIAGGSTAHSRAGSSSTQQSEGQLPSEPTHSSLTILPAAASSTSQATAALGPPSGPPSPGQQQQQPTVAARPATVASGTQRQRNTVDDAGVRPATVAAGARRYTAPVVGTNQQGSAGQEMVQPNSSPAPRTHRRRGASNFSRAPVHRDALGALQQLNARHSKTGTQRAVGRMVWSLAGGWDDSLDAAAGGLSPGGRGLPGAHQQQQHAGGSAAQHTTGTTGAGGHAPHLHVLLPSEGTAETLYPLPLPDVPSPHPQQPAVVGTSPPVLSKQPDSAGAQDAPAHGTAARGGAAGLTSEAMSLAAAVLRERREGVAHQQKAGVVTGSPRHRSRPSQPGSVTLYGSTSPGGLFGAMSPGSPAGVATGDTQWAHTHSSVVQPQSSGLHLQQPLVTPAPLAPQMSSPAAMMPSMSNSRAGQRAHGAHLGQSGAWDSITGSTSMPALPVVNSSSLAGAYSSSSAWMPGSHHVHGSGTGVLTALQNIANMTVGHGLARVMPWAAASNNEQARPRLTATANGNRKVDNTLDEIGAAAIEAAQKYMAKEPTAVAGLA